MGYSLIASICSSLGMSEITLFQSSQGCCLHSFSYCVSPLRKQVEPHVKINKYDEGITVEIASEALLQRCGPRGERNVLLSL